MTIQEKIRYLRLKQKLTLEAVGDIVGVGKSTVRKWESGEIANMRRDKIAKLAKALGTTPAYLMGWEDEESEKESSSGEMQLTEEEKQLLESFRLIPKDRRPIVIEMIRAALKMR